MNMPSKEFFNTLGQYVYGYKNELDEFVYIGKGNGKRSVDHIKTKGYDLNQCYVIAKNLERFDGKNDWQSFLLESFLIAKTKPVNNSVSGHYKECFIMAKLSDLFKEYTNSQHDNFQQLPDWYVTNYDKFRGNVGKFIITSGNVYIESVGRGGIYLGWYFYSNSENKPVNLKFTFLSAVAKEKLEQIKVFLSAANIDIDNLKTDNPDAARITYNIDVADIDAAINIFYDFMN